jgi:hypothetical protein
MAEKIHADSRNIPKCKLVFELAESLNIYMERIRCLTKRLKANPDLLGKITVMADLLPAK